MRDLRRCANRALDLHSPKCSAKRGCECPCDRASIQPNANKLRYRAGFRDTSVARMPYTGTDPNKRTASTCRFPCDDLRNDETRAKEESPSVERKSFCQNSRAASSCKAAEGWLSGRTKLKSIMTLSGLNIINVNNLRASVA